MSWYCFKHGSYTTLGTDGRCPECKKESSFTVKPPLGLKPKFIVVELRLQEIAEAMNRYFEARYPIPNEWLEEWNELINESRDLNK